MRAAAVARMLSIVPSTTEGGSMSEIENARPLQTALIAAILASAVLEAIYYYGGVAGEADDTPLRAAVVGTAGAALSIALRPNAAAATQSGTVMPIQNPAMDGSAIRPSPPPTGPAARPARPHKRHGSSARRSRPPEGRARAPSAGGDPRGRRRWFAVRAVSDSPVDRALRGDFASARSTRARRADIARARGAATSRARVVQRRDRERVGRERAHDQDSR